MKKNIFLDTQILVFGLQKNGGSTQQHMVKRAEALFENLDKQKDVAPMISSVVLAELLINVPPEKHDDVITLVNKYFRIIPFDSKAATLSARIIFEKTKRDGKSLGELCKEQQASRNHIKIDSMITANAKSYNALLLYTEDPHIADFAAGFISTAPMPTDPQQLSLLLEENQMNEFEDEDQDEEE